MSGQDPLGNSLPRQGRMGESLAPTRCIQRAMGAQVTGGRFWFLQHSTNIQAPAGKLLNACAFLPSPILPYFSCYLFPTVFQFVVGEWVECEAYPQYWWGKGMGIMSKPSFFWDYRENCSEWSFFVTLWYAISCPKLAKYQRIPSRPLASGQNCSHDFVHNCADDLSFPSPLYLTHDMFSLRFSAYSPVGWIYRSHQRLPSISAIIFSKPVVFEMFQTTIGNGRQWYAE